MAPYYNPYQQGYSQQPGFQAYQQPGIQQPPQSYSANLPQYQQPYQQPPFQSSNGINWVQGENGAKAYPVGANNSVLLMDSEGQYFYIKSADQSGMPVLKRFAYSEVVEEPMRLESHDSPQSQLNLDNLATKDDIRGLEQKISELHEMTAGSMQIRQQPQQQGRNNGGQKNG